MPLFQRSRDRRYRSDVSLVSDVISALGAARIAGAPVPADQLPVAVGLATLHADVLASMPMTAGRNTPAIVTRPNPSESYADTVHKLVQSAYWKGYAALLLDRPQNPTSASVLNPNAVTVVADSVDSTKIAEVRLNGVNIDPALIKLFNINVDPRRGPLGRSPLEAAAIPLRMYGYAYAYLSEFFEAGGNPSTVLRRTGLGAEIYDAEQAATDWITARQARRPAVLPAGWELSVPPNNGELEAVSRILETCAVEVCRLVNAPPSLANAKSSGSMTYSNVTSELARWLAIDLAPTWITRLENLFTDLGGMRVEADTSSLFRMVDPLMPVAGNMPTMTPESMNL